MWYKANNFFAETNFPALNHLFEKTKFVWDLLNELENFIKTNIQANVSKIIENGPLILKATAIYNNEVFTKNITYTLGEPAKGQLKVYHNNKLLEKAALILPGAYLSDANIEIGPNVLIETGAMIKGPCILKENSEVRQGAYIRGNVLALGGSLIGHSTEVKNCILLNNAKAGHFAYLGDSILGNNCNLGAGTKLANFKMIKKEYTFKFENDTFKSPRSKIGAFIGDNCQIACNCVTSPGTLLGKNCKVLPNIAVKTAYYKANSFLT